MITPRNGRWSIAALAWVALTGATGLPAGWGENTSTMTTPEDPAGELRLESAGVPHITLDASNPGDEEVVDGEVTEVRLFFSDAPLMRGASVRVVNASRKLQRSSPPVADPDDPKQISVQLAPALAPGTYVVQWRCIADDGHVMRGSFTFEVAAR
jgi:methionine-rich copper-binding protein CopC